MRNCASLAAGFTAIIAIATATSGVLAQGSGTADPTGVKAGVAVGYFPGYVMEDARTQQWGVSALVQLVLTARGRFEVAYTHVPQKSTTASAAPRLHAFRAMVVLSYPISHDGRFRFAGSAGLSGLKVDAQRIDCGPFPLCDESAPRDGTRISPVGGIGLELELADRLDVFSDVRVYRPLGETWSPNGDPEWLSEIGAGIRVRL